MRAISIVAPLPVASSCAPGAPSTLSMCAPIEMIGAVEPVGSPTARRMPMTFVRGWLT
jgi:hypothetical protein